MEVGANGIRPHDIIEAGGENPHDIMEAGGKTPRIAGRGRNARLTEPYWETAWELVLRTKTRSFQDLTLRRS